MEIRIAELEPAHFRARTAEALQVYISAMQYPQQLLWQRKPVWHEHSHWHGFTAVAALAPREALAEAAEPPGPRRFRLFHRASTASGPEPRPQQWSVAPGVSSRRPSSSEAVVGICYGYRLRAGQWWHDRVAEGARNAGTALPDPAVELTELHVLPRLQGHGLGGRLLEAFCATRSEPAVLLSTPEVPAEENLAWHLYRSRGFTDYLRRFHFQGDPRPFAVLRRDLPLEPAR